MARQAWQRRGIGKRQQPELAQHGQHGNLKVSMALPKHPVASFLATTTA